MGLAPFLLRLCQFVTVLVAGSTGFACQSSKKVSQPAHHGSELEAESRKGSQGSQRLRVTLEGFHGTTKVTFTGIERSCRIESERIRILRLPEARQKECFNGFVLAKKLASPGTSTVQVRELISECLFIEAVGDSGDGCDQVAGSTVMCREFDSPVFEEIKIRGSMHVSDILCAID